jgi:hypothetical protein
MLPAKDLLVFLTLPEIVSGYIGIGPENEAENTFIGTQNEWPLSFFYNPEYHARRNPHH